MSSPTPARGGEFFLDIEKAHAAIGQLEKVYDQLVGLKQQASLVASLPATAHDPVSEEAFALLRLKAVGPPGSGSFTEAMQAGMNHVRALIDQMKADIVRQEAVDADGRRGISRA